MSKKRKIAIKIVGESKNTIKFSLLVDEEKRIYAYCLWKKIGLRHEDGRCFGDLKEETHEHVDYFVECVCDQVSLPFTKTWKTSMGLEETKDILQRISHA